MSLKTKEPNKLFIQQFIINSTDSCDFCNWAVANLEELLKSNAIVGYFFNSRPSAAYCEDAEILNVYLIDRRHYRGNEIDLAKFRNDFETFKRDHNKLFVNPPFKEWLDTKMEWCNVQADKLVRKYNYDKDEALSEVYYAIAKVYNKPSAYIGNLGYIITAINNNVLVKYRDNKNKVNQDSGLAISIETPCDGFEDDGKLTLEDTIAAPMSSDESDFEYAELEKRARQLLSATFSPREIDQIINLSASQLPTNTYKRLLNWRSKHKVEELYG